MKALVATYATVDVAKQVVDDLVEAGFERSNIGIAARNEDSTVEGDGLIVVTVSPENTQQATDVLDSHQPLVMDTRDVQWRAGPDWLTGIPDTSNYSALPLTE
jgi:hypothetical protein